MATPKLCKSCGQIIKRYCKECGAEFYPKRPKSAKYCSNKCRQKAHRRKKNHG